MHYELLTSVLSQSYGKRSIISIQIGVRRGEAGRGRGRLRLWERKTDEWKSQKGDIHSVSYATALAARFDNFSERGQNRGKNSTFTEQETDSFRSECSRPTLELKKKAFSLYI